MSKAQPESERRVFDAYARYYDLLYKDKDYAGETRFVHEQLLRQKGTIGSLLELGCGTGRHAVEFQKFGCQTTGIDLSASMVSLAKERLSGQDGMDFEVGDVRNWRGNRKYDAVVSLFHVMSYQASNEDLLAQIETAGAHLNPGGSFFFDFWYGPAVLRDPPSTRIKRMEDEMFKVTRLAEHESDFAANLVKVNYEIMVEDKRNGQMNRFREPHLMRYFFMPELELFLKLGGFSIAASGCWMNNEPISETSWYAWVQSRKL